jgi:hypothetical protein
LHILPGKRKTNLQKKVHNLSVTGGSACGGRLRHVLARYGAAFSEYHSALKLHLRESQRIFAEFTDFFSAFVLFGMRR